jgi:predicted RNase H-like HicB family nuclease
MNKINLPVIIEQDEEGYFASCPSLQGCYTQADSYEEILENIKDAISLHIEDRIANGEGLPNIGQISLTSVEVVT